MYHAPPGTDRPSFAGVVASMDRNLATYHTVVTSQLSRCEVIENMEEVVTQQLRRFYELNGLSSHPNPIPSPPHPNPNPNLTPTPTPTLTLTRSARAAAHLLLP